MAEGSGERGLDRGIVHAYQRYDPTAFPPPTRPGPDLAGAAFEHMLEFGSTRGLTEEELARAIRLDPSMFPSLGPSIQSLRRMLEERKAKLLSTYEVEGVRERAARAFRDAGREVEVPKEMRDQLQRAMRSEQMGDLERLWYRQKREDSPAAKALLEVMERLGEKYQIEAMATKYAFTGREGLDVPGALELKAELEAIDALLKQLEEAEKSAQLAIIDMDAMEQMAEQFGEEFGEEFRERMEALNRLQQQIEDYVREQAALQGVERTKQGFRLSPRAYRLFQRTILTEVFKSLQASRSGRHAGPIEGEGVVEMQRTRAWEFGDSAANLDVAQTIVNAAARVARGGVGGAGVDAGKARASMEDMEVHRTKNNPKCATVVVMDMSGSMRYDGQYINCKRMAIALDGLIRTEYPGDFLGFVEMYSLGKVRRPGDLATLMPKPVSIHAPVVRLCADLSDPDVSEERLPKHFTNIQHALRLSRQLLAVQDTPNRQVMLITDGLPTAHFEEKHLYLLYPPDPRTEDATMREAAACQREGITINIFLLPNWSQSEEDVRFAHRMAERTQGRVFFTGGKDLDRCVLWDYVSRRRKVLG